MDTATGRVLASVSGVLLNGYLSGPVARLYVLRNNGRVAILDARGGRLLATTGPGVIISVVQVVEDTHTLVNGASGRLVHQAALTGVSYPPFPLQVDYRHNHLLILDTGTVGPGGRPNAHGALLVLARDTGRLVRRLPLHSNPGLLIIDGAHDRALVFGWAMAPPAFDTWSWVPSGWRSRLPFIPRPPRARQTQIGTLQIIDLARL